MPSSLLSRVSGYATSAYGVAFDPEGRTNGKRMNGARWYVLTEKVLAGGGYRCMWCHCRLLSQATVAVLAAGLDEQDLPLGWNWWTDCHFALYAMAPVADHLWPVSRGGHPQDPRNLGPSCWLCNEWRRSATIEELRANGLPWSDPLEIVGGDDFDGGREAALNLWDEDLTDHSYGRPVWPSAKVIEGWIAAGRAAQGAVD